VEILLLKAFLAPLLVVASTLAGRRWGPSVAGILVALPIVAGPILFISFVQHGSDFAGRAAAASLLGLISLAAFAVMYAHLAGRFGWFTTLAVSWAVVLGVDAVLAIGQPPAPVSLALTVAATVAALAVMPRRAPSGPLALVRSWSRWDLPGRALATAILVASVTTASSLLGPHWTGLLAPFPIALSVVSTFAHARQGADAVARTLAGALLSLFSFGVFCLCVALLVGPLHGGAFLVAAAATGVVQYLAVRTRGARGAARSGGAGGG
jgi:hypothetical protein